MIQSKNFSSPRVSIVIINWNQKEETLKCLTAVKKIDYPNFEVLFIDNGSKNSFLEVMRKKFPDFNMIGLRANIGAAAARNIGIKYALQKKYDYIFFLDNDAIVESHTLSELVRIAERNSNIAAVGAKTYYYNSARRIWNFGGKVNWVKGKFVDTNQGEFDKGQFNSEKKADTFPIGFGIVRTDIIKKVGGIDERYFIYYEEADWHIRIKRLGYELVVVPEAKIWHKVSSSLCMESPSFYYYRTRNRLLFAYKNSPRMIFFLFCLYFLYDFSYNTLLTLHLSKKPQQLRASVVGVLDFLRSRFGERALSEEILQKPLYEMLVLKLTERASQFFIDLARNMKFLLKRLLKVKLKILVKIDWNLGDEIMAIPIYKAIKDKFPRSIVDARVRFAELLWNNPYVDTINDEGKGYDKIFNLRGENKIENRLDFLSKKIKIKDRLPEVYIKQAEMDQVNIIPRRAQDKLRVAISSGAKWKSRQWDVGRFKWLSEYLMNKYDAEIIELGKDCSTIGLGINLINKTSVREAAIILKTCNLFIGNDSGLVHLALAVGTPTVAFFGPLDPFKLIENKEIFYPVRSEVACSGCWSDGRMRYPDICPCGIANCMGFISVNEATKVIDNCFAKLNNEL